MSSVVALSNTSGSIVETYSRACPSMFLAGDAFGNTTVCEDDGTPRSPNASLYANPYMYTARRFDSETSLYYYRARIYSPTLGRFLQPDPIGYAAGMNMYAYCGNDPINFVDPKGTDRWGVLDPLPYPLHHYAAVELWEKGSDGIMRRNGKVRVQSCYARDRDGGTSSDYSMCKAGFRQVPGYYEGITLNKQEFLNRYITCRIESNWKQDQMLLQRMDRDIDKKDMNYSVAQAKGLFWIVKELMSDDYESPNFCVPYTYELLGIGMNPFTNHDIKKGTPSSSPVPNDDMWFNRIPPM